MPRIDYGHTTFEWDDAKNTSNKLKHKVSFEAALTVFFDQNHLTQTDFVKDGEQRWRTVGMAENTLILFIGHLVYDDDGTEVIRIITARKATAHERKEYYGNH